MNFEEWFKETTGLETDCAWDKTFLAEDMKEAYKAGWNNCARLFDPDNDGDYDYFWREEN